MLGKRERVPLLLFGLPLCSVIFFFFFFFFFAPSFGGITKTYLYNFDSLKHFYIVKPGFTGIYIFFLISAQNINCGHTLESPRRGGSNEYPQSMF